jgi:subtilisin family serine protease
MGNSLFEGGKMRTARTGAILLAVLALVPTGGGRAALVARYEREGSTSDSSGSGNPESVPFRLTGQSASRADDSATMLYLVNTPPFDPLTEQPRIPPELTTQDPAGYYILQLRETAGEGRKQTLRNRGVILYGYVPQNGYLVHMREGVKQALLRTGWVRALVPLHPAFKVSPSLLVEREPPREFHCLHVHLFQDRESVRTQIEAVVRDVGGVSLPLENSGILQVAFPAENTRRALPGIAFIPGVKWIEETPRYALLNDDAAQFVQAPDAWNTAQLPGGLTGKGQIIAVADSGLDTGKAQTMHEDIKGRIEDAHLHSWPVRKDMAYGNQNADDGAADERSLQPYEVSATPPTKNLLPMQEAGHGTHVAGSALGSGYWSSTLAPAKDPIKGIAFEATLVFQAVDQWTLANPLFGGGPTWKYALSGIPVDLAGLFQQAYDDGARIHNNSWASEDPMKAGEYDEMSRQVDDFARNHPDTLILFGAGNAGVDIDTDGIVDPMSVLPPATAKNCVAIGATESRKDYALGISRNATYGKLFTVFSSSPLYHNLVADDPDEVYACSSRGPTADGRIRPDVVAPGSFILSTRSQKLDPAKDIMWGAPSQDGYDESFDKHYIFGGGTSMATPLAAGAAALVRQYLMEVRKEPSPSAALIKAILINGAQDVGSADIPNDSEGWGRINLKESVSAAMQYWDVRPGIVKEDQEQKFTFVLSAASQPLKITLAWTDHPAEVQATKALRNDLDLRLEDPTGAIYCGNNFSQGWSTKKNKPDDRNNVECIYIQKPLAGSYSVSVRGSTIPDPCQPYALVLRGDLKDLKSQGPGFTILLEPDERVLPAGAAAKYVVRVYYNFGFQGDVALSVPDASKLGGSLISTQMTPATLTPIVGAPYFRTSELSVLTDDKTPPDRYLITVNGVEIDNVSVNGYDSAELVVRAVDAIAVWQHEIPAAADGVCWDIWYSLWDNHSGIWWTMTEERAAPVHEEPPGPSLPSLNDRDPAIAFDRSGNAVAVWAQESDGSTGSGYDVWCSRWTPHGFDWGWTEPLPIATLAGDDTDPAVAIDGDGAALAVWVHWGGAGRYMYFSVTDEKGMWSAPAPLVPLVPLSNWGGGASLPEIAFTSHLQAGPGVHQAVAVWVDKSLVVTEAVLIEQPAVYYAIWDGAAWYNGSDPKKTKAVAVIPGATGAPFTADALQAAHRIGISSDQKGHAWVTWSAQDTTSHTDPVDITNYARWDGATWDIKATASKSQGGHPGNYGRHPAAAYNMSHTAITAYSHDTSLPLASTTPKPREIFYFYDEGDPIRGAKGVSGDPCYRPAIAVLPDDNVLAVWWADQQTPPHLKGEIWFSKSMAPEEHWIPGAPIMEPAGPSDMNDCNPAVASPTGSPTMPPASYP